MKEPCGNPVSLGLHRCDGPENIWYLKDGGRLSTTMAGRCAQRRHGDCGCAHGKGHGKHMARSRCAETSRRQRLCARERARKAYGMEPLRRDVVETADVRTGKGTESIWQGAVAQRRHGDSGCAHGKGHGKHMEWSCCAETSWRQRLCARERPRRHLYNAGDGRI